jgi:hypothetical protein
MVNKSNNELNNILVKIYIFLPITNTTTNRHCSTGRKSLWSWTTGPSLLKRHYSGSSVMMDVFYPLLLWLIVAMREVTSSTHRY